MYRPANGSPVASSNPQIIYCCGILAEASRLSMRQFLKSTSPQLNQTTAMLDPNEATIKVKKSSAAFASFAEPIGLV